MTNSTSDTAAVSPFPPIRTSFRKPHVRMNCLRSIGFIDTSSSRNASARQTVIFRLGRPLCAHHGSSGNSPSSSEKSVYLRRSRNAAGAGRGPFPLCRSHDYAGKSWSSLTNHSPKNQPVVCICKRINLVVHIAVSMLTRESPQGTKFASHNVRLSHVE